MIQIFLLLLTMSVFKITSGMEATPMPMHTLDVGNPVNALATTPNGSFLAAGEVGIREVHIPIWETTNYKKVHYIDNAYSVLALATAPDNTTLASSSRNSIKLWDLETGHVKGQMEMSQHLVDGLSYTCDGYLVSCDEGGNAFVWDKKDPTPLWKTQLGEQALYQPHCRPGRADIALCALKSREVKIWELLGGQIKNCSKADGEIFTVAYNAEGNVLAASCPSRLMLYDPSTADQKESFTLQGKKEKEIPLRATPNGVTRVAQALQFMPGNDALLMAGLNDGNLLICDTHDDKGSFSFKAASCISSLSANPKTKVVAVGQSTEQVVRIFNLAELLARNTAKRAEKLKSPADDCVIN